MAKIIGTWMILFMELVLMFTPIMFYIDGMHKEAAAVVLEEGAKKASIVGEVTPENIRDMKNEMASTYNYDRDDIKIRQTDGVGNQRVERGEYIGLEMEVPRDRILALDIFAPGALNETFTQRVKIMSEYQENGEDR